MPGNAYFGTALIGDKNNIIDGSGGKKASNLFNERAMGLLPSMGSEPTDPRLIENIRTHVKNYCAPGS